MADGINETMPPIFSGDHGEKQQETVAPVPPPVVPHIPGSEPRTDEPTSYPSFLTEAENEQESVPVSTAAVPPMVPPVRPFVPQQEVESPSPVVQEPAEEAHATEEMVAPEEKEEAIPVSEELVHEETVETAEEKVPEMADEAVTEKHNTSSEETQVTPETEQTENDVSAEETQSVENTAAPEATTEERADSGQESENPEEEDKEAPGYKSAQFLEELFNDNECLTVANGSFPIKDDVRSLLALFSNGRFFVAETARFDGKVLGFQYLAKKRRLQIGNPEYVPSIVINDIYEYAARNTTKGFVPPVVDTSSQEQARMQRDFVTIVTKAAMQRVSDIHIVVADHTTILFRVNGLMQTEMEYNKEWGESFVRAAFASADISDSNYAQNEYQAAQKLGRTPLRGSGGRLVLPRNVLGIRLQFNPIAFGTRYVVMRMLYAEDNVEAASDLAVLGFTKKELDLFYQMRAIPTGIVIVSGPTGSGKSTTLQRNMIAMLRERNYEINLITVEDPPEYPIPGARQMPVTNAGVEELKEREFTKALSAALRSDPDSLMIGEVRTLSAADLAFRGALSGHSVWTTLHANSAPAILMRLKDIGVEDFKLQDPSIMKGMTAQRLFRKLCPHCRLKASEHLDLPSVQRLRQAFGDDALEQSYLRGPGCEACDNRGVKGRVAVGEFLMPDATFLDLSVKGELDKAINYWINDLGGMTLRESAISRMLQGIVDIDEVERWTGFLDQQVMA